MKYDDDLKHALQLADVADPITRKYFRRADLRVTTKPDRSPVTEGDLAVEQALSSIVKDEFHEGYLGEEGTRLGNGKRVWVVDPIDGTLNFLRGMPIWSTLIALVEDGEAIAAVVTAPALGRRWWASKDGGSWTRDVDGAERQIHVSAVKNVSDAFFLTGELRRWDKTPMLEFIKSTDRHLALGDVADYVMVAEGAADAFADMGQKLWDMTAPGLIITEAGGSIWTNAGADTPPETSRTVVGTNGLLEAKVLEVLKLH